MVLESNAYGVREPLTQLAVQGVVWVSHADIQAHTTVTPL
jgi:hypothetical protein